MSMELVHHENGRFGVKPLFLGFIPVKVPFLDPIEFSFKSVEGELLSGVYGDGAALESVGRRVDRPRLGEPWLSRRGTYLAIDLGDDFELLTRFDVVERDGFLFVEGKVYGMEPFSWMLSPVNDDYAVWAGIGRNAGDTVAFEQRGGTTYLSFGGYVYRKAN
jgi:hypothetical protein